MKIVITGATGTIGARLVEALRGHELTVLSRDPERAARRLALRRAAFWDGRSALSPSIFEGASAVFHLAGEPIADGRWTAHRKRLIEESRVAGTRALVAAMGQASAKPAALVSASAVGFYGDRGDELLTESSAPGEGFGAAVCVGWEREAARAAEHGIRAVSLRIGIVLSSEGGALERMLPLFRAGLGGRLGSGRQWMPWVHIDDVVSMLVRAAEDARWAGAINAVAPGSATNEQFTRALERVVGRRAIAAVPTFALRAALGEMASVVLASQRVLPATAEQLGFSFAHPELEEALAHVCAKAPPRAVSLAVAS